MQKLFQIGATTNLFIVDEFTGQMYQWDGIMNIDEENLQFEGYEIVRLISDTSETFSCEIENADVFEDNIRKLLLPEPKKEICEIRDRDYEKPNPVYVPKHIARRRKW